MNTCHFFDSCQLSLTFTFATHFVYFTTVFQSITWRQTNLNLNLSLFLTAVNNYCNLSSSNNFSDVFCKQQHGANICHFWQLSTLTFVFSRQWRYPVVLLTGQGHVGWRRDRGGHNLLCGIQSRWWSTRDGWQGWPCRYISAGSPLKDGTAKTRRVQCVLNVSITRARVWLPEEFGDWGEN